MGKFCLGLGKHRASKLIIFSLSLFIIPYFVLFHRVDTEASLGTRSRVSSRNKNEQRGDFRAIKQEANLENFVPIEYDGRYEKPSMREMKNVSGNITIETRIENIQPAGIEFLPNYLSPCWFESVTEMERVYNGNQYVTSRDKDGRLKKALYNMKKLLRQRESRDGFAWRLRCLPYFYVAGAPRSATTDLYSNLMSHPQVAVTTTKEAVYWNRMRYMYQEQPRSSNDSTPPSLRHYLDLHDLPAEEVRLKVKYNTSTMLTRPPVHQLIIGDVSPSYMYDFDEWRKMAANRGLTSARYTVSDLIHAATPQAKIIFILRNPSDRLLSDYNFFFPASHKRSAENFHGCATRSIKVLQNCMKERDVDHCLRDPSINSAMLPLRPRAGLYEPLLKAWYGVFPVDQILVVRFEDYVQNTKHALDEIYQFLGLDKMAAAWYQGLAQREPKNQSNKMYKLNFMWPQTRAELNDFYKPWNLKLAHFLNDSRFLWNDINIVQAV